jgi:hypothetical protein
MMGAARLDLDGMRPSARTLFSTRSSCESRNDMMLLYHPPLSDVCEPSPLKGVVGAASWWSDSLCGVGSCWQLVVWYRAMCG